MAMDSLHDLSALTVTELHAVYHAIAEADHRWRIKSFYGDAPPPIGHSQFRPLPLCQFQERYSAAASWIGGDAAFRQQLARQAAAYRVDVPAALADSRSAA